MPGDGAGLHVQAATETPPSVPRGAPAGWPRSKRCLLSALRQSLGPSSKAKSQFCQLTINLGPWQFGVSTLPDKGRRPALGLTQNKHLRAESPRVEEVGQAHTPRAGPSAKGPQASWRPPPPSASSLARMAPSPVRMEQEPGSTPGRRQRPDCGGGGLFGLGSNLWEGLGVSLSHYGAWVWGMASQNQDATLPPLLAWGWGGGDTLDWTWEGRSGSSASTE